MKHQFCFHITNGITREALICGTITAESMEAAAEIAAKRTGLSKQVKTNWAGISHCFYILHDPKP